jgi:predicted peptidase
VTGFHARSGDGNMGPRARSSPTIAAMPPPPRPVTPDDLVVRSWKSTKHGVELPYRLYVPRDYLQSKRYPLLLVLHGSGEKGADNEKQLVNGVLAFCDPKLQKQHPTFVVYPQCPEGARWVEAPWQLGRYEVDKVALSHPLAAVLELADALAGEFTVDLARLLVAGLSMGGYGTWDLLARVPDRIAGAMPVCGGGDPSKAAAMARVPVWAFHGAEDPVVPVAGSRRMVAALKQAGGRVRYTEYPKLGHNAWDRAFADRRALRWLLSQQPRRSPPAQPGKQTLR